jgi:hypothetical protein
MYILDSQQRTVSTVINDEPLAINLSLPPIPPIPEGLWFDTGEIQLQTRLRFDLTDYGNSGRDTRFHNPPRSKWGWVSLLSGGYVSEEIQLQFEKQTTTIVHPIVAIYKCRNSVPKVFNNTTESGDIHLYSIAETPLCLKAEGLSSPPGSPLILTGEGVLPAGSTCLRGHPAQIKLVEDNVWPANAYHSIVLSRLEEGWIDEIGVLLYPRSLLEITIDLLWSTTENQSPLPVLPLSLNGDAPFPIYSYGCALGVPVPSLTNPICQPGNMSFDSATGTIYCDQIYP